MALPTLKAIKYKRGSLELLDQTKLPDTFEYVRIAEVRDAWEAIHHMKVRGAPAIAVTGALAVAAWAHTNRDRLHTLAPEEAAGEVEAALHSLRTARPTAVNLFTAIDQLTALLHASAAADGATAATTIEAFVCACEKMFALDVKDNEAIGRVGFEHLKQRFGRPVSLLTHCNTGSLATAGYGTALGVVRAAHAAGQLQHVYCTETRPYNQGSRLTATEIVFEKMPGTLITDSMAAALMKEGRVDAVVVGADRVAANGDTANKIGTYSLAVLAAFHKVPFFVAAPLTTMDVSMESGAEIEIEQRAATEITHFRGTRVTPDGIGVWNPAFDVTPAELIAGIVTDRGLIEHSPGSSLDVRTFVQRCTHTA